ncbi:MAG: hypothetical protein PHD40_10330, partial [Syntrophomonadaceae bacterium]|nr:hypothetical protein [Syntrophomonadaceae bacterium]
MTFKWTPGYTQSGYYTKIHFEASDGSLTASQDINITVRDLNRAPDVSGAYSCPGKLWPATLLRYPIDVKGITDPDGDPVEIRVTSITADEPTTIIGVGSNCIPDATGVGTGCPTLRAEFGVLGNGRVYCVTFAARDGEGGVSVGAVKVSVLVSACIPA